MIIIIIVMVVVMIVMIVYIIIIIIVKIVPPKDSSTEVKWHFQGFAHLTSYFKIKKMTMVFLKHNYQQPCRDTSNFSSTMNVMA